MYEDTCLVSTISNPAREKAPSGPMSRIEFSGFRGTISRRNKYHALQAVRIHTDIIVQRYRIFVLCRVSKRPGLKQHFAAVVGIRSNLELAAVGVEGEHVEPHWAEEGDVGGLAVEHILICTYPHTFKSV